MRIILCILNPESSSSVNLRCPVLSTLFGIPRHPQSKRLLTFSLCKSENQRVRAKFPDHHSKHPGVWNADPESRFKTKSGGGEGAKRPARLGKWPETKKPDAWAESGLTVNQRGVLMFVFEILAARAGIEPAAKWLTATCSTAELPSINP